jgi:hypothetical protein
VCQRARAFIQQPCVWCMCVYVCMCVRSSVRVFLLYNGVRAVCGRMKGRGGAGGGGYANRRNIKAQEVYVQKIK